MSGTRVGQGTLVFGNPPGILGTASIVGQKEGEGPLKDTFDYVERDTTFGEKTWEKAESRMQRDTLQRASDKAGIAPEGLDMILAGDLLNQCIGSTFGLREYNRPFIGLYGACSTMAESLMLAAMAIDGGYARTAAALTSSHFCSSERQYRFPLEYGAQRVPTAQWTVTGAGAAILSAASQPGVRVTRATAGKIVDYGIKEAGHMGAAMAPAAFDTLRTFFEDTGTTPEHYDLIATGDLGAVGSQLLCDLLSDEGVSLGARYMDCGAEIFDRNNQDVQSGGSGCGCGAVVLCGKIYNEMMKRVHRRVLFCGTGALLSPISTLQGESIPSICHLVELCRD